MRITFGQYNQPYYEYGSQRSLNQNYKNNNAKDKLKTASIAIFGVGCISFGLLSKRRH